MVRSLPLDLQDLNFNIEIRSQEDIMQMVLTFLAVVGGLAFSLAIALPVEEVIFGQVFRLFFAPAKLANKELVAKSIAVESPRSTD